MASNYYLIGDKFVPVPARKPTLEEVSAKLQPKQKEEAPKEEETRPQVTLQVPPLTGLTKAEMKAHLDALNIPYKARATEKELAQLLAPYAQLETQDL